MFEIRGIQGERDGGIAKSAHQCNNALRCLIVSYWPGVSYHDANGNLGAETFVPEFEIFTPAWTISSLHSNLVVTEFTAPANGNDGTFAYAWSGTDMNGNAYNGTATGTWSEIKDWRGWYHAVVKTSPLTVSQ